MRFMILAGLPVSSQRAMANACMLNFACSYAVTTQYGIFSISFYQVASYVASLICIKPP